MSSLPFVMTSSSFPHMGTIPVRHTCDGADLSPQLAWSGIPDHARSLVLMVDDPDAPDPRAPKMTWVHWLLYNMSASIKELPDGMVSANLPAGTLEGLNDWKTTGYRGPCPPVGQHRYFYKLFALDSRLPDLGRPEKKALTQAMQGHVLAYCEMIGLYQRHVQRFDGPGSQA